MTRLIPLAAALALAPLLLGCESTSPPVSYGESGDLEVRGWSSDFWPGADASRTPNCILVYETTARQGSGAPFHRMKTEVRLSYDPETGEILNARILSSEDGRAYRHVCLAPSGPVLHVRMATVFDGRAEDLTVVKLHEDRPALDACEEVGVGPKDGLVESFDILFRRDGTYRVLPDSRAYLAGVGLKVERRMNEGPDPTDVDIATYP